MIYISSLLFTIFALLVVKSFIISMPHIGRRISPYDLVSRVRLNTASEYPIKVSLKVSLLKAFFLEIKKKTCITIFRYLIRKDDDTVALQLKQAGLETTVLQYKISLTSKLLFGCLAGFLLGIGLKNISWLLFSTFLGGFIGYTKSYAHIEKNIEGRKEIIRLELATINQLLAIYLRTGSGVTQAITYLTKRISGLMAQEMLQVLSRTSNGIALEESLLQAANTTPEPHATRTYKLLASGSVRGIDLAQALLDLAQDLKRSMREDIRSTGAKKEQQCYCPQSEY